MGLFGRIINKLQQSASNGRNSTQLILLFQENKTFADLALQTFQRCVAERGLELNQPMLRDAEQAVSNFPGITMGQFLNDYINKYF